MRNNPRAERGYSSKYPNENKWDILSDEDRQNRQINPERVRRANRAIGSYMEEESKPNSPLQKIKEFALSPVGLSIEVGTTFAATIFFGTPDLAPWVYEHAPEAAAMLIAGGGFVGASTAKLATDAYAKEYSAKHRAERERRKEL